MRAHTATDATNAATLTMRSFRRGTASAQAACRETAGRNGGTGAPARSPRTRIINPHNSRWTTAAAGSDSITVKKLVITNAEEGSDASTLLASKPAATATRSSTTTHPKGRRAQRALLPSAHDAGSANP